MSKSLGNVIEPQKVSDTLGAEILRLWVAATDYSGELSISDEILKRVVESYRRIRNTLRFLLANTADFDPRSDAVPVERVAGDRPLRAGAGARGCRREVTRRLRALRVPPGRAEAADASAPRTWARSTSTSSRTGSTRPARDSPRAALGAERAVAHHADACCG